MELEFTNRYGKKLKGTYLGCYCITNSYEPILVFIVDGEIKNYLATDLFNVKIKKEN